ncbi:MAG: hypothetical protein ACI9WR_001193 [Paracoccaceae bacterium]
MIEIKPLAYSDPMQTVTQAQARKIALFSQKLHSRHEFDKGMDGTLAAIDHLGYVQIDTLAVVERAHSHTLWNRVNGYLPEHLNQLQLSGKIFEHWAHALAYLPTADFRYSLPMMNRIANGESHWYTKNPKETNKVLHRITSEGPLSAKDFTDKKSSDTTWSRSPSKRALEQLFMEGTLMIRKRVNFHKVYDLTERVLEREVDTSVPTTQELCQHLLTRFLNANGLGHLREVTYLRKGLNAAMKTVANEMVESGNIINVIFGGIEYYCRPDALEQADNKLPSGLLRILSPFDNAIIQRKRIFQLFDYDYQIECYVPKEKRKFGYFCLPLLYNNSLVARIDAKADRKNRDLHIAHLHLEKPIQSLDRFYSKLLAELKRFADFNGCDNIVLHKVSGAPGPHW